MGRLTEAEKFGQEEYIWSCDCVSEGHYLRITWDDDPRYVDEWKYMSIDDSVRPRTIRERIKWAWKALRGQEVFCSEIILNEVAIAELKEFFNTHG